MIDTFVVRDLIRNNMRDGTIAISFDEDKIYVSANYKERCQNATDTHVTNSFVIDRRHTEG